MATELNRSGKKAADKKRKSPLTAAQRLKQRKLKQKMLSTGGIIILVLVFLFCIIFLVQRYFISRLDSEVTALEQEYAEIKGLNESKEGQIIQKLGYAQIQTIAEGYGMRTPSEDQLVTETVTLQPVDESGWAQTRWYHRLLQ